MNYTKLKENIIKTYQIAKSRNWFIQSDLIIGDKASTQEIVNLEKSIGKKLPSQLIELLTGMSKSVNFHYQIEEETPKEFSKIFAGEFSFNLEQLEQSNKDYPHWIEASLEEEVNDEESIGITKKVKDNKTVLFEVCTGDLIVVDDESNEVLYFDHEGDKMHGKILGKDLNTFLEQWSLMGFFGTEGWQFEEMYDFEKNRLKTLNDSKVNRWISWLNKKASR